MKRINLDIVDDLNTSSKIFENEMDPVLKRKTGSYYTSLELATPMVNELIKNLKNTKRSEIYNLRFLEPCVGTGNFVFAYILALANELTNDQINKLLNNIYVCDINKQALDQYKKKLTRIAKSCFGIKLTKEYFDKHIGEGLLFNVNGNSIEYISIESIFGVDALNSFDIVVTNPPYKNLKAEIRHYENIAEMTLDKNKYKRIAEISKERLPLSSTGTINLYKLFVEEIVEKYAAKDALVSLLVPTTILTDKTCERIRKRLIDNYYIISIKNIPENNRFINAQQTLTAILIDKGSKPEDNRLTSLCKVFVAHDDEFIDIKIRDLATKDNGYTILALSPYELKLLNKMIQHPRIKDLSYVINLRGELDLTANKLSITNKPTKHQLIRGRNVGYYSLDVAESDDYVEESFVIASSKRDYTQEPRLACQQISNIARERRLGFVMIDPGMILANSCNFISVKNNDQNIDIYYILGLLNSKLMNWYFKIHSSNNHINNYEIDNFPIPLDPRLSQKISKLVKNMKSGYDSTIAEEIDSLVSRLFDLQDIDKTISINNEKMVDQRSTNDVLALSDLRHLMPDIQLQDAHDMIADIQSVESTLLKYGAELSNFDIKVLNGIVTKYRKLDADQILNHTTFKLSDLDLEMITPIPQGGNWKDIAPETVAKSQRLIGITKSGGRTTLYGRLDYLKPSYTITTYFNRPGNGTYVHPKHNRVLSVREAARFQAFPDDYYFYGNKTQTLKQIGNAVPALLAFQIGMKIKEHIGNARSIDLFCGAGGLTSGFKDAGIETVLCTDFDEAACITLKINNPESEVICGDITDKSVKSSIVKSIKNSNVDVVCGGPPCQGFSMAGYRDEDDPRNQLFKEFVEIVEKTNPKVVIFENVQGILTFKGGETYNAVHELFTELGYKTEGRLLKIDRYGVPQKRKRVIIICTRIDTGIDPSELYPDEVTPDDNQKVTVADTIFDLESIECSDTATYGNLAPNFSNYNKMLKRLIPAVSYLENLSPKNQDLVVGEQLVLSVGD